MCIRDRNIGRQLFYTIASSYITLYLAIVFLLSLIHISAFGESAVQEQRTVGNMDAILLRREVRHLRFQFQHFQNVGDLPWDVCLLYTSRCV